MAKVTGQGQHGVGRIVLIELEGGPTQQPRRLAIRSRARRLSDLMLSPQAYSIPPAKPGVPATPGL